MGKERLPDVPVMSDLTILVSVEDLISIAMGPPGKNVVNFKMIQTVLHILARQMRMLSVHVDMRISENYEDKTKNSSSDETSSPQTPRSKKGKKGSKGAKSKDKTNKMSAKEKEEADKEMEKIQNMSPRQREKYLKEKEQKELERMSPREREQYLKQKGVTSPRDEEERRLEKMSPRAREKYLKDKEEMELNKMSPSEREKYFKEKEKKKLESMKPAEREKYLKEQSEMKKGRDGSKTSIAISEGERGKHGETVLKVERGPAAGRSGQRPRIGSIEVVTQSQFNMLKAVVKRLAEKAGPMPMPSLPDNEKLRSELAKGSASLTDTMQAMQVSARVQAAEQTIDRLVGLLTHLAAVGAFPEELSEQLESVWADLEAMHLSTKPQSPPSVPRKSVAIDPQSRMTQKSGGLRGPRPPSAAGQASHSAASVGSRRSSLATQSPHVTLSEMNEAIQELKEELLKSVNTLTTKATSSAETAAVTAKSVAAKLDVALNLNSRITTLYGLTTDYTEQLNGFDVGITTQMQGFQEQMIQMRGDLAGGLQQLQLANNNAETAAVMELTERFEMLATDLDTTVINHQNLATTQNHLADELRSLVEAVEMLREQKADTDEVIDGLRDKADLSRLTGLLTDEEFAISRTEMEARLDVCYDKFHKQENVWMTAIKDLTEVADAKAQYMQLLALKEDTEKALNDIKEKLRILALQLGEPKAAVLSRLISKDGACAACGELALMEPTEKTFEAPPPLPALRPPPAPPCVPAPRPPDPEGDKVHVCHRWVGGSHTVMTDAVKREKAAPMALRGIPVKKYTGVGSDGKLYLMEDEIMPCEECNKPLADEMQEELERKEGNGHLQMPDEGAGDTVKITTVIPRCICTTPH